MQVDLTASQRAMYDNATLFWKEALGCFEYARQVLDFTRKDHPDKWLMTNFWAAHQRFFRSLCMSIKIPTLVGIARKALDDGMCVVIGLQSTGEARLNDALASGDDLDDFRGLKAMVQDLVRRLPDGDYLRQYQDALGVGESDDVGTASSRRRARGQNGTARAAAAAAAATSDEEDDAELQGWLMHSEDEEATDADESDDDDDQEGEGGAGSAGGTGAARAHAHVKLPKEVRLLANGQLRQLLSTAGISHQQAISRKQLLDRVRHVEARAAEGSGPPLASHLMEHQGWARGGGVGSKREGAEPKQPKQPKQPKREGKAASSRSGAAVGWQAWTSAGQAFVASAKRGEPSEAPGAALSGEEGEAAGDEVGGGEEEEGDPSLIEDEEAEEAARQRARDPEMARWQCVDPYEVRRLRRMRRQLLRKLEAMPLPAQPLDALIEELGGPGKVAEMTGRKGRLVAGAGGRKVYRARTQSLRDEGHEAVTVDRVNLIERAAFMKGTKLVAIISEAASCGISLQADRRVANQRRRVHITLELPWSADQAIQQCGRTHRSNQVHRPIYRLLMHTCMHACMHTHMDAACIQPGARAHLPAAHDGVRRRAALRLDRRQAAAGARRYRQRPSNLVASNSAGFPFAPPSLSTPLQTTRLRLLARAALTKGDRRAADAADLSAFDVDTKWGKEALESLLATVTAGDAHLTPPDENVRAALDIKLSHLQVGWGQYLEAADDALAAVGVGGAKRPTVKTFLNRLLGLPVGMQNKLFSHFTALHEAAIKAAKDNNDYDDGVVDVRGEATIERAHPRLLATDPTTRVALHHYTIKVDRGLTFEALTLTLTLTLTLNLTLTLSPCRRCATGLCSSAIGSACGARTECRQRR